MRGLALLQGWRFLRDTPRVIPYVRPYWRLGAAAVFLSGLGVLVSLMAPWPLAIIVDTVLGKKPVPSILKPLIGNWRHGSLLILAVCGGLVVIALQNGLNVISEYVTTKLDQRMVLDLRSDMFRHSHRLSQEFHDRTLTGALMYRINNQASAMGAIAVAVPPLGQAAATLVGMFIVTYTINAELALLALTVVPFIYYSIGYYATRIQPRLVSVRGLEGQSLSIVHESMAMLRVVVAFGREQHEYRRFRSQAEEAVHARIGLTVRQTLFSLAVNLITAGGTALVLWFGAHQVLRGELTVGELLVVLSYIAAVYQPLQQISSTIGALQNDFISLRGALGLLARVPDVQDAPTAVPVRACRGQVTFDGVDFDYRGREGTLKGITFEAAPGERIGVVGPTGAGKTTLISLIPRFFDPKRGTISLDGQDLTTLTLASLRAQVSLVHQEPLLFSGTIAENIRYGRLEATDGEIIEAAKAANAHEFITGLPKQYKTVLGERGAQLSGGERQRISVARAFLKDSPILILDEPTSSIDSRTEGVILEALRRLMAGRTSFMIAHRLSTVRDASRILVLDEGRLVEQGTHDDLVELGGLYAQLHEAQVGPAPRRPALAAVGERVWPQSDPGEGAHALATAARLLLEVDPAALRAMGDRAPDGDHYIRAADFVASLPRDELALLRDLNEDVLARDRHDATARHAHEESS